MERYTALDYKKELEKAAKRMILIHRPDTLIKLILRTIVRILGLEHASLLLYDKNRDAYIAHSSKGKLGAKIPQGLAKVSKENPLIYYFTKNQIKDLSQQYILFNTIQNSSDPLAKKIEEQLFLHNAIACIPGFYRDKILFLLLLGRKLNGEELLPDELDFISALSSDAVMAINNAQLFQDLEIQLKKNQTLFLQTVLALSSAIEAKDRYTQGHTERVTQYSSVIALELKEKGIVTLEKDFLENLRIASLLHDIGKIGVPESILNKNGSLTEEEFGYIKRHPLIGAEILSKVEQFQQPILGVKYHHERYDGMGYPEGLKEEQIPLIAQIIAVADTFDALTSDRPYRKALSKEEAIKIIEEEKNKQFSELMVEALLSAYRKNKL